EVATRDAGGKTMEAFKSFTPTMIGGAADLVESTKTEFKGGGVFSATHAGRNIAFGIREHAMGSIVNGIALHGGMVKPYGSTFLIFSDYMRPAVRLSALSQIPVVWAWTHDSVGLGEDGPTHQPVEHYAALRAIPNFWFMRPADAKETVGAWKVALEREDGPVGLALSRQKLPTLEGTHAGGVACGGYVVWEAEHANGLPDLILLASGSEVHVALEAAERLAADGVHGRVVSLPCWELFEAQPADYRDEVLPPEVKARLSIEAGVELGWSRWVGDEGASISIERFGASAPGPTVLEHLGITADAVVARALALREPVS
ncbi:MAG: transketolase-like TK C-terminal-containing protein, partial [Gaiellaceae bacterium]